MTFARRGTRRFFATASMLAVVFGAASMVSRLASAQRARPARSPLHRHPGMERPIIQDSVPELALADTALDASAVREGAVADRRGRHSAFTVDRTRLYVLDRRSGRFREVRGLPFEGRPFSDLAWTQGGVLLFDHWSSPHYAMHYALDVARRRIVASQAFNDRGR